MKHGYTKGPTTLTLFTQLFILVKLNKLPRKKMVYVSYNFYDVCLNSPRLHKTTIKIKKTLKLGRFQAESRQARYQLPGRETIGNIDQRRKKHDINRKVLCFTTSTCVPTSHLGFLFSQDILPCLFCPFAKVWSWWVLKTWVPLQGKKLLVSSFLGETNIHI